MLRWRLATAQKGWSRSLVVRLMQPQNVLHSVAFRCILLHFGAPNSHSTSRHRSADEHKANLLTPVIRVTRVRTVSGLWTACELSEEPQYGDGRLGTVPL